MRRAYCTAETAFKKGKLYGFGDIMLCSVIRDAKNTLLIVVVGQDWEGTRHRRPSCGQKTVLLIYTPFHSCTLWPLWVTLQCTTFQAQYHTHKGLNGAKTCIEKSKEHTRKERFLSSVHFACINLTVMRTAMMIMWIMCIQAFHSPCVMLYARYLNPMPQISLSFYLHS